MLSPFFILKAGFGVVWVMKGLFAILDELGGGSGRRGGGIIDASECFMSPKLGRSVLVQHGPLRPFWLRDYCSAARLSNGKKVFLL